MNQKKAKELSARILKIGVSKIYIDPAKTQKVDEAMTAEDIKGLISERIVRKRRENAQSKGRARILKAKKLKGRKSGKGKRKGTKKARTEKKATWMNRVRAQRKLLKELKVSNPTAVAKVGYSKLYKMVKGNYFKGKKYLQEFIEGGKQ
ncbi:MAG: 50S ribosomal protein L19e [Candidatus ainarchaeum sp.]|nr:50S ribosomal protein L19e [Candidatus ainarchaeum sp.]